MAGLSLFSKNLLIKCIKVDATNNLVPKTQVVSRLLSYSSKEYDEKSNPAPVFLRPEVQSLLRTLTRVDLAKVFRRRKLADRHLEQPTYRFMTDQQLEAARAEMRAKAEDLLQIPPVVAVRASTPRTLAVDPQLQGLETARLVFADITFGVGDAERTIVVREPDGALRTAEWSLRDRVNQIYFPVRERALHAPPMFEAPHLDAVLARGAYAFLLDRACLQFEPNDAHYHRITSIAFQHLNGARAFGALRSTRHFGALAFFLAWHRTVDELLIDLLESGSVEEIEACVELYAQVHGAKIGSVEEFIEKYANQKAALELALQAHKDAVHRQRKLEEGIQRAHGIS